MQSRQWSAGADLVQWVRPEPAAAPGAPAASGLLRGWRLNGFREQPKFTLWSNESSAWAFVDVVVYLMQLNHPFRTGLAYSYKAQQTMQITPHL